MNQKEYLDLMLDQMVNINKTIQTAVIADFTKHFKDEKAATGKKEEEISKELGLPRTFSHYIWREVYSRGARFNAVELIGDEANENMNYNVSADGITDIALSLRKANCTILSRKGAKEIEITIKDMNREENTGFDLFKSADGNISICERWNDLRFMYNYVAKKPADIEIVLPVGFNGKINLIGGSGNVTATDLSAKVIDIKTLSGDVTLKNCKGEIYLSALTDSGNVDTDDCAYKRLTFFTDTGYIKHTNIESKGTNGNEDVIFSNTSAGETNVKNSRGNLKMISWMGEILVSDFTGQFCASSGPGRIEAVDLKLTEKASFFSYYGNINAKIKSLAKGLSAKAEIEGSICFEINKEAVPSSTRFELNSPENFEIINEFKSNEKNDGNGQLIKCDTIKGGITIKSL